MDKTNQESAAFESLADVRARIDAVDEALLQSLIDRVGLIEAVHTFKSKSSEPHSNAMRPGRETLMLRRLIAQAEGKLPPELILRIWRELVSWATQKQSPMGVHISGPHENDALWDCVRAHFGGFAEIRRHDTMDGVLGVIADKPEDVAVLPAGVGKIETWLGALMSDIAGGAKIAGCLPLIGAEPEAYLLGTMAVEETGDDRSLIYMVADPNQSETNVKAAFEAGGLEVVSLLPSEIIPLDGSKIWLVTLEGHCDQISGGLELLAAGDGINAAHYIGGYPAPIDVGDS